MKRARVDGTNRDGGAGDAENIGVVPDASESSQGADEPTAAPPTFAAPDAIVAPPPLASRPSLDQQLATLRRIERPWSDEQARSVHAALQPDVIRDLALECHRSVSRHQPLAPRAFRLLHRILGQAIGTTADTSCVVPTATRLPTALWTRAFSWCSAQDKYRLLRVSHACFRLARMPASWTGGVWMSKTEDGAKRLMRMFPDAARLAARIVTRFEARPAAQTRVVLDDFLAYAAPRPNANVRTLVWHQRNDGGTEPSPDTARRLGAAFPCLTALRLVHQNFRLLPAHVQQFCDAMPSLSVLVLRRTARYSYKGKPERVRLPPSLVEFRDYTGVSLVVVGDDDSGGSGGGRSAKDDGAPPGGETLRSESKSETTAAVSRSTAAASGSGRRESRTVYALRVLHLAAGADIVDPGASMRLLPHLNDCYYQPTAWWRDPRTEARTERESATCRALLAHPSITRLHLTLPPDFFGDSRPFGGVMQPHLERLWCSFRHSSVLKIDWLCAYTHLRDLRLHINDNGRPRLETALQALARSVASTSRHLEYVQILSDRHHVTLGFDKSDLKQQQQQRQVSHDDDGETKRSATGDQVEVEDVDGIDRRPVQADAIAAAADENGFVATHAFLWLFHSDSALVLLPHTSWHDADLHAEFACADRPYAYTRKRRRLGLDGVDPSVALLLRRGTVLALFTAEALAPTTLRPRPRVTDAASCAARSAEVRESEPCYCDATPSCIESCSLQRLRQRLQSHTGATCSQPLVVSSGTDPSGVAEFAAVLSNDLWDASCNDLWSDDDDDDAEGTEIAAEEPAEDEAVDDDAAPHLGE